MGDERQEQVRERRYEEETRVCAEVRVLGGEPMTDYYSCLFYTFTLFSTIGYPALLALSPREGQEAVGEINGGWQGMGRSCRRRWWGRQ